MANVELKKDFRDGQLLYGNDLNNNFQVIEAGINANEENLQDVINQAQDVLRNELVDITTDRGWDWEEENPIGTRVSFFKGTTQQLEQYEAHPGQLLYNVETGETYLEEYGERIVTGSGNALVVSEEEPTNPGTKVWINPDKIVKQPASNVVDSLEGNETDKSPSVKAVKEAIEEKQTYSTEEQVIGTWIDGKPIYRKTVMYKEIVANNTIKSLGNLNLETVVSLTSIAVKESDGRTFLGSYYDEGGSKFVASIVDGLLTIWAKLGETYTVTVTLEYTKTTD